MTELSIDWDDFQRFTTYQAYFDAVVGTDERKRDNFYLEDETVARDIELGRRVDAGFSQSQNILQPHEFEKAHQDLRNKREKEARFKNRAEKGRLSSQDTKNGEVYTFCGENSVVGELAKREVEHRLGVLCSVVYLRYLNKKGQEVSGYIDFGDRLKNEEGFGDVFSGKKRLVVKKSDLSYYNWNTGVLRRIFGDE